MKDASGNNVATTASYVVFHRLTVEVGGVTCKVLADKLTADTADLDIGAATLAITKPIGVQKMRPAYAIPSSSTVPTPAAQLISRASRAQQWLGEPDVYDRAFRQPVPDDVGERSS